MLTDAQFILYIIKLVLGGIASFFSIMLLSKTRDFSLLCLVFAVMGMYGGIIYDLLVQFGIVLNQNFFILGISFFTLFFTIIPYFFLIIALILFFLKLNK